MALIQVFIMRLYIFSSFIFCSFSAFFLFDLAYLSLYISSIQTLTGAFHFSILFGIFLIKLLGFNPISFAILNISALSLHFFFCIFPLSSFFVSIHLLFPPVTSIAWSQSSPNYIILSREKMYFILYLCTFYMSLKLFSIASLENWPQRLAHIRNVT